MNTSTKRFLFFSGTILLTLLLFSSCAKSGSSDVFVTDDPYGFWSGLWHGIITPISFVISLFNEDVAIYGSHNTGGWYDLGFIIGIGMTFGGSGSGAKRCK